VVVCPDNFCVVFVASTGSYSVLPRDGHRAEAMTLVNEVVTQESQVPRPLPEALELPMIWLIAYIFLTAVIGKCSVNFDARTREMLRDMCCSMGVPGQLFALWESRIGGALFEVAQTSQVVEQHKKNGRNKQKWKIAGAAVGGGLLLALTGGAAAPAIAGGLATVANAAASISATAGLTQAGVIVGWALTGGGMMLAWGGYAGAVVMFGATGLGLTSWKLSKRWGDVEEFEFVPLVASTRKVELRVELADQAAIDELTKGLSDSGQLVEDTVVETASGDPVALLAGTHFVGVERPEGVESQGSASPSRSSKQNAAEGRGGASRVRLLFERSVEHTQNALHLGLFISGWVEKMEDIHRPWVSAAQDLLPNTGHLVLKWETSELRKLTKVFSSMLTHQVAWSAATFWWQHGVVPAAALSAKSSAVVAAGTVAATTAASLVVWPVSLISHICGLDNEWHVVVNRSEEAGKCLANVLVDKKAVGQRPITLVGHSMGARLIFMCLLELYRMGEFNVVSDVVLVAVPEDAKPKRWRRARAVVTGRLINVYAKSDWVLAILYRYLEMGLTVAGLNEVKVAGVENLDVTGLGISGHHDYGNHMDKILAMVRLGERCPHVASAGPTASEGGRDRRSSSVVDRLASANS